MSICSERSRASDAMKQYFANVIVGLDQFANTLLGGHPGETISARSGRAAAEGKTWGKVLSAVLNKIQPNHTALAEQHDAQRADTVEYLETGTP